MRVLTRTAQFRPVLIRSIISNPIMFLNSNLLSTKSSGDDDEWNDAWETAWLPDDLAGKEAVAPWESDVNFGILSPAEADAETKAFVEDMNENWEERRKKKGLLEKKTKDEAKNEGERDMYSLENMRKDYRLKKQRIHAALWVKEIEKLEESRLGADGGGGGDDIDKLLDSCSEFFDPPSPNNDSARIPSSMEFRNKPDGWETTARDHQDGSIWDMTQREEDILVQEFERRMAFCKHQIASFVKTHIFSRRRPIDGWKYMIEEIGPNAKKGKGSVSRLPSLSDPATQPFKEEAASSSIDSSGNHRVLQRRRA